MLTDAQIRQFAKDGYVRIDDAFDAGTAAACLDILWRDAGCDPNDPATWTKPLIRLGGYSEPPFVAAANTAKLREAYNQLVGVGRWLRPTGLGTFPIRFPSRSNAGDLGWHIDVSFPDGEPGNFLTYRANIFAKDRVLTMFFLFSDIGHDDAPTRIRLGSHRIVARILVRHGERGLRSALGGRVIRTSFCRQLNAVGRLGTVYLCHPFLVHAAQKHRGTHPRIIAQPPLMPVAPFDLKRADPNPPPVELASREAWASLTR